MPGNKEHLYSIEYLPQVVDEDIADLTKKIRETIKRAIETRLAKDPISFGKPLQYSLKGHRRLRVGNYRVVYRVHSNDHIVIIVAIKHRKEVYQVTNH